MSERLLLKIGAVCTILYSFALFSSGIIFIAFVPQTGSPGEFYRLFLLNPYGPQAFNALLALSGFLGFFIVVSVYFYFRNENEAWSLMGLIFGIVWAFSQTIHGFSDFSRTPTFASGYFSGNETVRAAIAMQTSLPNSIDPKGVGSFGFLAIWFLILGLLMFFSKKAQKPFGLLALTATVLLLLLFAGQFVLIRPVLVGVVPSYSLILGPLLWLLLGAQLWPTGTTAVSAKSQKKVS